MIQLSSILSLTIFTFSVIGYLRGFDKELIATSGIVLALFTLVQFNDFLVTLTSGSGNPLQALFYLQAITMLLVTFFAYQTPTDRLTRSGRTRGRGETQSRLLGVITGGFNGYLVFGSLWFYLDEKGYPIDSILPPEAGTASAGLVSSLPLSWLLEGNLLTLLVIGLFLFILIAII
jgi:uncharacterized membrane protein required for colicin V production